ncbi:MAG: hypothetical protein WC557_10135 [Ignavibacteriaceae bacterium]
MADLFIFKNLTWQSQNQKRNNEYRTTDKSGQARNEEYPGETLYHSLFDVRCSIFKLKNNILPFIAQL